MKSRSQVAEGDDVQVCQLPVWTGRVEGAGILRRSTIHLAVHRIWPDILKEDVYMIQGTAMLQQ